MTSQQTEPDLEALRRKVDAEIDRLDVIIGQVLKTFPEPWVFANGRHLLVDCASSRGHMEVAVLVKDDDCEREMQALRNLIRKVPTQLFHVVSALRRVMEELKVDLEPEVMIACRESSVQALENILRELNPDDKPATPLPGA